MHFERIYFVAHRKENILVNQAIAKRTAHPPSFETGQMCNFICIPLIFKRLKKRVHPEVNSLKRLSSACIESERPLLLRKEWGNAGETRLLPNATPSEVVQGRFSAKMALGEVPGGLGIFWQTGIKNNHVKYKYRRLRTTLLFLR